MYETFYGLKEKPFSMIPDPEYLFLSAKHQRALTLLEYGLMNHAGFSVICGDTGAGKTTLIRRLLNEMGEDTTVGLITNTHQSFGELLNWVLMAFGIDPENRSKAQMHQLFVEFLVEQYARNKRTVLIVDEAQNMSVDTLEELRMLSNINADKDQVIQVILAGQPGLRETLRKPELMQFAQRIAVDYYLEALSKVETSTYISHRLKVAGAENEIFTQEACNEVYKYSGGTPRLINLLCDTSLVYGFAEQTKIIDGRLVNDVVREQHRHSVVRTFKDDVYDEKSEEQEEFGHEEQRDEIIKNKDVFTENNPSEKKIGEAVEVIKDPVESGDVYYPDGDEEDKYEKDNIKEAIEKSIHQEYKSSSNNDNGLNDSVQEIEDVDGYDQVINKEPDEYEEDFIEYRNRRRSDLYPVVQLEDKKKSNISGLIFGFSAGMFLASILLVVFVFTYGVNVQQKEIEKVDSVTFEDKKEAQSNIEANEDKLKLLQSERDRAMEISKALERERDAAIAAAKAQEEMRAAEKRAAEIIAEQERKAAIEVRRAKERALQAEISAAKAKEREKLAFEKAELERIKAEKVKLEKEIINIKTSQVDKTPEASNVKEVVEVNSKKAVENKVVNMQEEPAEAKVKTQGEDQANNKFIRNPCDSPSAKFLSTCKK